MKGLTYSRYHAKSPKKLTGRLNPRVWLTKVKREKRSIPNKGNSKA